MADLIPPPAPNEDGGDWSEVTPQGEEPSTSTIGGSPVGGQATMKFNSVPPPENSPDPFNADYLANILVAWLGTTLNLSNNGRLQRQLPICHPYVQEWIAKSVVSIQGRGQFDMVESEGVQIDNTADPYPNFALFDQYEATVNFGPPDYYLFQDEDIPIYNTASNQGYYWPYSLPSNTLPKGGLPFYYCPEWYRFTDYIEEPIDNNITGRQGMTQFWAPGLNGTGNLAKVDGAQFSDMPKQYLPDAIVRFQWLQVPYRYVTSPNSFLKRYKGFINQNPFPPDLPPGVGAMPVYQPGELQYLSFKAKKYTRPPIRITTDPNNIFSAYLNNPNFMGYSKLCDIELTFLATRRAYPNRNETPPIPNNFNYVVGGHNLMPATSLDRLFHYAQTVWAAAGNPSAFNVNDPRSRPFLYSAPLELLWMDPDALQPPQSLNGGQLYL